MVALTHDFLSFTPQEKMKLVKSEKKGETEKQEKCLFNLEREPSSFMSPLSLRNQSQLQL